MKVGRSWVRKKKERKKTDNPREGWEDGTLPPHRDFKEGTVWYSQLARVLGEHCKPTKKPLAFSYLPVTTKASQEPSLPWVVCFLSFFFREGWEDGTPPPHRDFKEGTVWC